MLVVSLGHVIKKPTLQWRGGAVAPRIEPLRQILGVGVEEVVVRSLAAEPVTQQSVVQPLDVASHPNAEIKTIGFQFRELTLQTIYSFPSGVTDPHDQNSSNQRRHSKSHKA